MTTPPSKRGFLIMPFDSKFDWLRDDILAAGRSLNIVIERADDIFAPGVLLDQVLDAIDQAAVVVGICTGKNANVFFELGYAWRSHSPALLARINGRSAFRRRPLPDPDLRDSHARARPGATSDQSGADDGGGDDSTTASPRFPPPERTHRQARDPSVS
jgi:hypothetical protein